MKTASFITLSFIIIVITLVIYLFYNHRLESFNVVSVGTPDPIFNGNTINTFANGIDKMSPIIPVVIHNAINDLSNNVIKQITITSNKPSDPPSTIQTVKFTLDGKNVQSYMNNMNSIDPTVAMNTIVGLLNNVNNVVKNIKSIDIQTVKPSSKQ